MNPKGKAEFSSHIDDALFKEIALWAKDYTPWPNGKDYPDKVRFLREAIEGRAGLFLANALVRCSPDSIKALLGVLKVASRGKSCTGGYIDNMAWSCYEQNFGWLAQELFGIRDEADPNLVTPEESLLLIAVARTEPWLLLYYRTERGDFRSGFTCWAVNRIREIVARYRVALGDACKPVPQPEGISKYWPEA